MYFTTIRQPFIALPFNIGNDNGHLLNNDQYITLLNLGLNCQEQATAIDGVIWLKCLNVLSCGRDFDPAQRALQPPIKIDGKWWFIAMEKPMAVNVKHWHSPQDAEPYAALVGQYIKSHSILNIAYIAGRDGSSYNGWTVEFGIVRGHYIEYESIAGFTGPWIVIKNWHQEFTSNSQIVLDNIVVAVVSDNRLTMMVDLTLNGNGLKLLEAILIKFAAVDRLTSFERLKHKYNEKSRSIDIELRAIDKSINDCYTNLQILNNQKLVALISSRAYKQTGTISDLSNHPKVCDWSFTDKLRIRVGPLTSDSDTGSKHSLGYFTVIIANTFEISIVGESRVILYDNYHWTPSMLVPRNGGSFCPIWDGTISQAFADLIEIGDYYTIIDLIIQYIEDCKKQELNHWPLYTGATSTAVATTQIISSPYNGYHITSAMVSVFADMGRTTVPSNCSCSDCASGRSALMGIAQKAVYRDTIDRLIKALPSDRENSDKYTVFKLWLNWICAGASDIAIALDKWYPPKPKPAPAPAPPPNPTTIQRDNDAAVALMLSVPGLLQESPISAITTYSTSNSTTADDGDDF